MADNLLREMYSPRPSLPPSLPPLRRGLPVRVLKLYRRMRRKGVEPSASALTQVGREGGREGRGEARKCSQQNRPPSILRVSSPSLPPSLPRF